MNDVLSYSREFPTLAWPIACQYTTNNLMHPSNPKCTVIALDRQLKQCSLCHISELSHTSPLFSLIFFLFGMTCLLEHLSVTLSLLSKVLFLLFKFFIVLVSPIHSFLGTHCILCILAYSYFVCPCII